MTLNLQTYQIYLSRTRQNLPLYRFTQFTMARREAKRSLLSIMPYTVTAYRKKERKRERESEYISCMPNDMVTMVTAGNKAPQVEFPSSVLPVLWMCLVYTKFNGLSCMVPGYRFWGGLSLYSVPCTSLTKNSCNTKVVLSRIHNIPNCSNTS